METKEIKFNLAGDCVFTLHVCEDGEISHGTMNSYGNGFGGEISFHSIDNETWKEFGNWLIKNT